MSESEVAVRHLGFSNCMIHSTFKCTQRVVNPGENLGIISFYVSSRRHGNLAPMDKNKWMFVQVKALPRYVL